MVAVRLHSSKQAGQQQAAQALYLPHLLDLHHHQAECGQCRILQQQAHTGAHQYRLVAAASITAAVPLPGLCTVSMEGLGPACCGAEMHHVQCSSMARDPTVAVISHETSDAAMCPCRWVVRVQLTWPGGAGCENAAASSFGWPGSGHVNCALPPFDMLFHACWRAWGAG